MKEMRESLFSFRLQVRDELIPLKLQNFFLSNQIFFQMSKRRREKSYKIPLKDSYLPDLILV